MLITFTYVGMLRIETCDEQPDHQNVHISQTSRGFSTNDTSFESSYFYLPHDASIIRMNVESKKE